MRNSKKKNQTPGHEFGKGPRATTVSPFEYVNAINNGNHLINDDPAHYESLYNAYMANKAFSFHLDTIFQANEMNLNYHLDNKMQYDYLFSTVRQKRRSGNWMKKEKNDDLRAISEYYKINNTIAQMYLNVMSEDEIIRIRKEVNYEPRK